MCLPLSYCHVCFLQSCGHLLDKGWPLGSIVFDVFLFFVTFPYGVLSWVWYFLVLIPDLCLLSYLDSLFKEPNYLSYKSFGGRRGKGCS